MTTSILFVTDYGPAVGQGHLVRAAALAEYLEAHYDIRPVFLLSGGGPRPELPWQQFASLTPDIEKVVASVRFACKADAVVFDLERGAPSNPERWAAEPAKTIAMIGAGYKAVGGETCDLTFVQGIPDPPVTASNCFAGPEYVVLRDEFAIEPVKPELRQPGRVFVCGGGADPLDITALACDVLNSMAVRQVDVVIGPFYKGKVTDGYLRSDRFFLHRNIDNPFHLMRQCGMAIVSYGMTALECLACGLPTLAISMSDDHEASAAALAGALVSVGQPKNLNLTILHNWISSFLHDSCIRLAYSAEARRTIDGRGAERVAAKIMELL